MPIKVTPKPKEFEANLVYAPYAQVTFGEKPEPDWKNLVLKWKDLGFDLAFKPDTGPESAFYLSSKGDLAFLKGALDAEIRPGFRLELANRINLFAEFGPRFKITPSEATGGEATFDPTLFLEFGGRQYMLLPDGFERDDTFKRWEASVGFSDFSTFLAKLRFQTDWQLWDRGFAESGIKFKSHRKDDKPLHEVRPADLTWDQEFTFDVRSLFALARIVGPGGEKGTDVKLGFDYKLIRKWDKDIDNAAYTQDSAEASGWTKDSSAADVTSFDMGVALMLTAVDSEATLDPSTRKFSWPDLRSTLKDTKPSLELRFGIAGEEAQYGGLYYISTQDDESVCSQKFPGSGQGAPYTSEDLGGFGLEAQGAIEQCLHRDRNVALTWNVRGDFIDAIGPRIYLGREGNIKFTPGIGGKLWVEGPRKGTPEIIFTVDVEIAKMRGRTSDSADVREIQFEDDRHQIETQVKGAEKEYKGVLALIEQALTMAEGGETTNAQRLYEDKIKKSYKDAEDNFANVRTGMSYAIDNLETYVDQEFPFDGEKRGIVADLKNKLSDRALYTSVYNASTQVDLKLRELEDKLQIPNADRLAP